MRRRHVGGRREGRGVQRRREATSFGRGLVGERRPLPRRERSQLLSSNIAGLLRPAWASPASLATIKNLRFRFGFCFFFLLLLNKKTKNNDNINNNVIIE